MILIFKVVSTQKEVRGVLASDIKPDSLEGGAWNGWGPINSVITIENFLH